MLSWTTALARSVGVTKCVCVVGEANQDVRAEAESLGLDIAIQEPQLGTAHAVLAAKEALSDFYGNVAVLYADTPLIETETVEQVFESLKTGSDVVVLGFEPDEPGAYGRLITQGDELLAIVEAKEATPEQLAVRLCNSGVMAASREDMFAALDKVDNKNAKGEYYLTDIIEIMRDSGKTARAVSASQTEVMGVNSRPDLALAEAAFQNRMRAGTEMGANSKAGNFVETKKAKIGKGSKINHLSYIGDAEVGQGANIGAGTITCNYDGYFKHTTVIGDRAFVGTNSSLVAPVKIGKGAYLGSGGVITKDVPEGALAVARAEQVNKEGWADRYNAAQAKRKAKK